MLHVCRSLRIPEEDTDLPELELHADSYELPDLGVGDLPRVHNKTSISS